MPACLDSVQCACSLPTPPCPDDTGTNYCDLHFKQQGWGPPNDDVWRALNVPNDGILIANNLFLNPTGSGTQARKRAMRRAQRGWRAVHACCRLALLLTLSGCLSFRAAPFLAAQATQFYVAGPQPFCNIDIGEPGCVACTDLPATVPSDTNLFLRGNVVWNFARGADGETPLGFEWSGGCQAGSSCNETAVRATNAINNPAVQPQLFNPDASDFR